MADGEGEGFGGFAGELLGEVGGSGGGGGGGGLPALADPGYAPGENPSRSWMQFPGAGAGGNQGGGGGGWDRFSTGLMNEVSQSPLKAFTGLLGLGGTGFNIANQLKASGQLATAEKGVANATKQAQAAAAPAVAAGTQDIRNAEAGKLQPGMEAGIQDWLQKAVADIKARFSQMGLGNSTQEQSAVNQAKLQAQAMRGQLLQSEEQIGGQLVGTGVNAAIGGGQLSAQQQQLLTQIIAGGNEWLGRLTGRQA